MLRDRMQDGINRALGVGVAVTLPVVLTLLAGAIVFAIAYVAHLGWRAAGP